MRSLICDLFFDRKVGFCNVLIISCHSVNDHKLLLASSTNEDEMSATFNFFAVTEVANVSLNCVFVPVYFLFLPSSCAVWVERSGYSNIQFVRVVRRDECRPEEMIERVVVAWGSEVLNCVTFLALGSSHPLPGSSYWRPRSHIWSFERRKFRVESSLGCVLGSLESLHTVASSYSLAGMSHWRRLPAAWGRNVSTHTVNSLLDIMYLGPLVQRGSNRKLHVP